MREKRNFIALGFLVIGGIHAALLYVNGMVGGFLSGDQVFTCFVAAAICGFAALMISAYPG